MERQNETIERMRLQVWAWRCEVVTCGHIWLATGFIAPAQCSKCKSRQWNKQGSSEEEQPAKDIYFSGTLNSVKVTKGLPNPFVVNPRRPTIEDRKAVAMQAMSDALMVDHPNEVPETVELCGKEWPNRDTGQWGRCGLTQGHRGNCGRFTVFDKVD